MKYYKVQPGQALISAETPQEALDIYRKEMGTATPSAPVEVSEGDAWDIYTTAGDNPDPVTREQFQTDHTLWISLE